MGTSKAVKVAGGGDQQLRVIPPESNNDLKNPLRNQDNYPVAYTYNGAPAPSSTTGTSGVSSFVADWGHYGAVFLSPEGLGRQTGFQNYMLYPYPDWEDTTFSPDPVDTNRVLKLFGAGALYPAQQTVPNTVVRGQAYTSGTTKYLDQYETRTAGHMTDTVNDTASSTTSMDNSGIWTHEAWTQWVDIPAGTTHITFGVTMRVPAGDQLRTDNWGGVYVWQDILFNGTTLIRQTDYVRVYNSSNTNQSDLPTGTAYSNTGNAQYNWNVYGSYPYAVSPHTCEGANPLLNYIDEVDAIDQDDLGGFVRKEYQVEVFTFGTDPVNEATSVGIGLFFAENAKYRYDEDSDDSGSIEFFNPSITFQTIV
jgi:hypothetical protein